MKTSSSQAIIDFILERLGQLSRRPQMYGGSAEGVDLCYRNYLELWGFATGNAALLESVCDQVYLAEGTDAMGFPGYCRMTLPAPSDTVVIKYVVRQWLRIIEIAAVPIPWSTIDEDLTEVQEYIWNWWGSDA